MVLGLIGDICHCAIYNRLTDRVGGALPLQGVFFCLCNRDPRVLPWAGSEMPLRGVFDFRLCNRDPRVLPWAGGALPLQGVDFSIMLP